MLRQIKIRTFESGRGSIFSTFNEKGNINTKEIRHCGKSRNRKIFKVERTICMSHLYKNL